MSQPVKGRRNRLELLHMIKTQNVAFSCKKNAMVHVSVAKHWEHRRVCSKITDNDMNC